MYDTRFFYTATEAVGKITVNTSGGGHQNILITSAVIVALITSITTLVVGYLKSRSDSSIAEKQLTAPAWKDFLEKVNEHNDQSIKELKEIYDLRMATIEEKNVELEKKVDRLSETLKTIKQKYAQALYYIKMWVTAYPEQASEIEIPEIIKDDLM